MFSKRIKQIANLVDKEAKVIDIGTDHAYLPIYLYINNITKNITASDVSDQVLKYSLNSIKKYNLKNKIKLLKSDGFINVNENYDIAVITGMGFNTIKKIISSCNNMPNTFIIQSNNDLEKLRKFMNSINYYIDKEVVLLDKGKYYNLIKYKVGKEILSDEELEFGKSYNLDYLNHLLFNFQKIFLASKDNLIREKINRLELIIEKIQD